MGEKEAEKKIPYEEAVFGAGCFWGSEEGFRTYKGVVETKVGFSGGDGPRTYEEVYTDKTGHAEVVKVAYDPQKVSYEELLKRFFFIHFSTELNEQRGDIGTRYRSAIFYRTPKEKELAIEAVREEQKKYKYQKVRTEILPFENFYEAESYHQRYMKNQTLNKGILRFNWLVENFLIKKFFLRFKR